MQSNSKSATTQFNKKTKINDTKNVQKLHSNSGKSTLFRRGRVSCAVSERIEAL